MSDVTEPAPVDDEQCPEVDPDTGIRCAERVGRHHCGANTHSYKREPWPNGIVARHYWTT